MVHETHYNRYAGWCRMVATIGQTEGPRSIRAGSYVLKPKPTIPLLAG